MNLLLLFLFSLTYSEELLRLECGKDYSLSVTSNYLINPKDPSFTDNCNITIVPDVYIVPFLNSFVYNRSYDGIYISSDGNEYASERSNVFSPSVTNTSIYWIPAPFVLFFYFMPTYESHLELFITAQDIRPNGTSQLTVYDDGSITFLDSEFLTANRTAISLFGAQNKTIQVRGFNYPEELWSSTDQDTLFIFSEDVYLCSAYDLIHSSDDGSHPLTVYSILNRITVISRKPEGKPGITFLAALNYTFPGEVQVKALSQTNGPIPIDATVTPQVMHYVAPRLTNTVRYSTHFTFIGNGNLTFYAGAITGPRDNLLLATITEKDATLTVPLTVKGRGRTLTLDSGTVFIDSTINFENGFCLVKEGQRGIFMSSNYPFSSGEQEFDAIKLYGENDEIFTFHVEILAPGLIDGDFLTLGVQAANGTNQSRSFTSPSQESFTATGRQLYIRYTIGAKSDGMLIRYTVLAGNRLTTPTPDSNGRSSLAAISVFSLLLATIFHFSPSFF